VARRHIFLAVFVVIIVLLAFTAVEVQSACASGESSGYTMVVNYQIRGGGSPTAPTITYIDTNGVQQIDQPISLFPDISTLKMRKNTKWEVKPNFLIPSTEIERWTPTQPLSGKSGSTSKTFTFQHQYFLTVNSPHNTPSGSGWYDSGKTAYAQLSCTTVQGTSGTRYVFTQWSPHTLGTNQKSNPIRMDAPKTATALWKTQYQVTLSVNPWLSGSTSPQGTSYYESGQTLSISANKYDGNQFIAWIQTGTITIVNPAAQTSTATINSPGTITANFDKATFWRTTHLTVSCPTTETGLNQIVTLSGILTNKDNQPIDGKEITLSYCPTENSYGWTTIGTATTSQDGAYELEWTTNMPLGSYFVMAKFDGDLTYRDSNAIASNTEASLTVVPEYFLGGLAALGACFGGLIVFRKRNSLSHFKRV
jgi:hypothetical protein